MALTFINEDAEAFTCVEVGGKVIGFSNSTTKRIGIFEPGSSTGEFRTLTALPTAAYFGVPDVGGGAAWAAAVSSTGGAGSYSGQLVAVDPDSTFDFWTLPTAIGNYPVAVYCGAYVLVFRINSLQVYRLELSTGSWTTLSIATAGFPRAAPRYLNGYVWWAVSSTVVGRLDPATGVNAAVTVSTSTVASPSGNKQRSVAAGDDYCWHGGASICRFDTLTQTMRPPLTNPMGATDAVLGYGDGYFVVASSTMVASVNAAHGATASEPVSGKGSPNGVAVADGYAFVPFPTR